MAEEVDAHSPSVYEQAKVTLERFVADKILMQDEKPCYYIYRQQMGSHLQIGLVAAASLDAYANNHIKKHELTRPDKEQDRVDHIIATRAQTGAVFLTYKENAAVNLVITKCMDTAPVYDFAATDGIRHTFYVVDEQADIIAIDQAFQEIPVMYIADGHHRSAAALRVREILQKSNPGHTGQEEYNFFLAVIFPHNMMQIMDYNRVVTDLKGMTAEEFLTKIQKKFDVAKCQEVCKPQTPHTFGMYFANQWYKLTAKPEFFNENDRMDSLDVNILQNNLLQPLLGIDDPRRDKRISFVGGIRGMAELVKLVNSGDYKVAFSLFPTSIEELMAIADAGEIMPPKSTWFEPKLRDAMAIHLF